MANLWPQNGQIYASHDFVICNCCCCSAEERERAEEEEENERKLDVEGNKKDAEK